MAIILILSPKCSFSFFKPFGKFPWMLDITSMLPPRPYSLKRLKVLSKAFSGSICTAAIVTSNFFCKHCSIFGMVGAGFANCPSKISLTLSSLIKFLTEVVFPAPGIPVMKIALVLLGSSRFRTSSNCVAAKTAEELCIASFTRALFSFASKQGKSSLNVSEQI